MYPRTLLQTALAASLPLTLLLTLWTLLLPILGDSKAQAIPLPKGVLVDAQPVEADQSVICSSYLNRGKVEMYLSRPDGKPMAKKRFWTIKTAKKAINRLKSKIIELSALPPEEVGKKLKKAKKDKKLLLKAKKHLAKCNSGEGNQSPTNLVRFTHVKPILQRQCISCHGVLGWENTEDFYFESGLVREGKLDISPIYTFLSNTPEEYAPGYMPKGLAPIPDVEILLLARWILDMENARPAPTPTPGGPEGEGRALYQANCAACHGNIDVSAKWGRTAAQIKAAIGPGGIPQMRHLPLTDAQIDKIALALSKVHPPEAGTVAVRSLGPVAEGNGSPSNFLQFEISFTGNSREPFNVGYVTSNGSALADSDYAFSVGTVTFIGMNGESHIVNVQVLGDTIPEGNESVFLDIGGITHGGVRVETSTAMGTISNDDVLVQHLPPLSSQVRLAYGFNGNFADAVGLADGVPQGDTAFVSAAPVGTAALDLDDANDYVTAPGTNLVGISSFSLATWVYWENETSASSRIFDFGGSSSDYLYFLPRDSGSSTGRCRFTVRGAGTSEFILFCPSGVRLPDHEWVHLAVVFDSVADTTRIYFNGEEVASRTDVTLNLATNAFTDNRIGRARTGGQVDFDGKLDELIVWDAALTQAQVTEAMEMTESTLISGGMEVRLNGQLVSNGSILNLGSVEVGENLNFSMYVNNLGPARLDLVGDPNVRIGGEHASEFHVQARPWAWQAMLGLNSFASLSVRYQPNFHGPKIATLLIPNSDLQNGNYAIGLSAQATGDSAPDPSGGEEGSPLSIGQQLYTENCSSCHGALATSQKRGADVPRVTNALSGIPQMGGLGLNAEQIALVVLALNSPVESSGGALRVENSVVNIGTAPYIASVFRDIFLPADVGSYTSNDLSIRDRVSEAVLGVRNNGSVISGRVRFFGGRQDRFEAAFQTEAFTSSQRPVPNTIRSGLIIRACDDVLSIDKSVDNLLEKIGRTVNSPLNTQAIKDIYLLFHPGKELPQYLADVISTFTHGAPNLTARDHWRYSIHLFCSASEWEVL